MGREMRAMNVRLMSRALLPVMVAALAPLGARQASAQSRGRTEIPDNTVVRLKLDQSLSSRTARVGERFAAVLSEEDRSGFPMGTRFQGVVKDVRRHSKDKPGVLGVEFARAYLPDGARVDVDGKLASLAEEDVRRTSDGRLESRGNGNKMDWKWAGYGAAGAAVISALLGENILKGAVLGGVVGAAYGYFTKDKKKGDFRDVDLPRGTEFGMVLDRRVAFNDRPSYRYTAGARYNDRRVEDRYSDRRYDDRYSDDRRSNDRYTERRSEDYRYERRTNDRYSNRPYDRSNDRVLGERYESRFNNATVRVNGRTVYFGSEKPRSVNGVLYLPLAPIADEARMRLSHRRGENSFTLDTPEGLAEGRVGESRVYLGRDSVTVQEEPLLFNNTVFVSAEFLRSVAGMRADWDRDTMRLDLETNR